MVFRFYTQFYRIRFRYASFLWVFSTRRVRYPLGLYPKTLVSYKFPLEKSRSGCLHVCFSLPADPIPSRWTRLLWSSYSESRQWSGWSISLCHLATEGNLPAPNLPVSVVFFTIVCSVRGCSVSYSFNRTQILFKIFVSLTNSFSVRSLLSIARQSAAYVEWLSSRVWA